MDPLFKLIETDYKNKVAKFSEEKHEEGKIIFIGDSMFSYWDINSNLKNDNIINWGIGGDTTLGVLDRLDILIKLKPKVVVVSIGSNDLIRIPNTTFEDIAYRINLIINKLEDNIANVEVHVLSILPILNKEGITNQNYLRERTNEQINEINDLLETYTDTIDVNSILKDTFGNLDANYTSDGVHLNKEGYKIFSKEIALNVEDIEVL